MAAYYPSQFLNATLPGGVVGGLYRAVVHGRRVGDVGRGLRTVAPVCLAVVLLVASTRLRGVATCAPAGRFRPALTADLYRIVVRRAAPRLMVAAATTSVPLPPRATLVPGLLVLLAAAVPVNAAGWVLARVRPRGRSACSERRLSRVRALWCWWPFGAGATTVSEPAEVLQAGRDADG